MHSADFCIVVAEDDEVLRYCVVRGLESHGYKVIEARDGQEALELVEQCHDPIHLLISNYNMPRMNGLELIRRLKAREQNLVVLIISGQELASDSDEYELLPKPFNQALLARKVREMLRRAPAKVAGR